MLAHRRVTSNAVFVRYNPASQYRAVVVLRFVIHCSMYWSHSLHFVVNLCRKNTKKVMSWVKLNVVTVIIFLVSGNGSYRRTFAPFARLLSCRRSTLLQMSSDLMALRWDYRDYMKERVCSMRVSFSSRALQNYFITSCNRRYDFCLVAVFGRIVGTPTSYGN